jgi:hypothetical protein
VDLLLPHVGDHEEDLHEEDQPEVDQLVYEREREI